MENVKEYLEELERKNGKAVVVMGDLVINCYQGETKTSLDDIVEHLCNLDIRI